MSYEEARKAAQENLRDALNVAPGTDLNIEYYDCIDNIIEAAVEKCKEELGQTTTTAGLHQVVKHDYIRPKSMPEVRAKGWDDAVQAAVSLVDKLLALGWEKYPQEQVGALRERISELGGQG